MPLSEDLQRKDAVRHMQHNGPLQRQQFTDCMPKQALDLSNKVRTNRKLFIDMTTIEKLMKRHPSTVYDYCLWTQWITVCVKKNATSIRFHLISSLFLSKRLKRNRREMSAVSGMYCRVEKSIADAATFNTINSIEWDTEWFMPSSIVYYMYSHCKKKPENSLCWERFSSPKGVHVPATLYLISGGF